MTDIMPKAIGDQIAAFCMDNPPTYEALEKHIGLLTTTIYCLVAEMLHPDAVALAFSRAESVLVKELGYPPELVQRCLEQLKHEGQRVRSRSFMVECFGSLGDLD